MQRVLARGLRALSVALFAIGVWADAGHASLCVWGEVEQPDPRMAAITHNFLTSSSFRIGTKVLVPAMEGQPAGGYPIRFLPDGTLESRFSGAGTRWAIIHGAVKLMYPDGLPSHVFAFDPSCGTLVSRQKMGERPFHIEIRLAPPGP